MPARTTQGGCSSAAGFQEKVEQSSADLEQHLEAWIKDFIIFAPSEPNLLRNLRHNFKICRRRCRFVSLPKPEFFLCQVTGCGPIIGAQGVRFYPMNVAELSSCKPPRTAGELSE